ncbi:MAG: lactonase family protein, partial [Verrucomicrobiota bacterium]
MILTTMIHAQESLFYIGSYTKDKTKGGIWSAKMNTDTGAFSVADMATPAPNPTYITISPEDDFVFAAEENTQGTVASFQRSPDGKLSLISRQSSSGSGPCHVEVDRTGKTLFVANYTSGTIASYAIQPDGVLSEPLETFDLRKLFGISDPAIQSHAHGNYIDSANHTLYSCDLGTDSVGVFQFNAEQRKLTPLASHGKLNTKSGPRHLAFHPSGKWLYVNQEMSLAISIFERHPDGGIDTPLQVISTIPEGTETKGVSTAEILCHPSGKWIYLSNRGHDSITVFAVGNDGKLSWVENVPSLVKFPRGMMFNPSGKWLLVAGQKDNRITSFRVDPSTGKIQ